MFENLRDIFKLVDHYYDGTMPRVTASAKSMDSFKLKVFNYSRIYPPVIDLYVSVTPLS